MKHWYRVAFDFLNIHALIPLRAKNVTEHGPFTMWHLSPHLPGTSLVIQSATWEISFEPLSSWPFSFCQRGTWPETWKVEGISSALGDNMTRCHGQRGIVLLFVIIKRHWLLLPSWHIPHTKGYLCTFIEKHFRNLSNCTVFFFFNLLVRMPPLRFVCGWTGHHYSS